MRLVVAIHGILTSQTDASWPDKFDAWMARRDPAIKVLKKEYRAGPFPRFNVWLKDPWLAKGLTNEILEFCEIRAGKIQQQPEIWLVAHSNGCVIALLTIQRLRAAGIKIAGGILIAGACESDVHANHLLEHVATGFVGKAIAFSSDKDWIVASKIIRPYGHLGHTGFTAHGSAYQLELKTGRRLWTEWHPDYGHGDYFEPAHRERTFVRLHEIITAQ